MQPTVDFNEIAKKVFEGTKYKPSDEEVARLANNIALLRRRGLENLNCRLFDGGRKIWDTFSEHNFAATLLNFHPEEYPISYEPSEFRRPPDFAVLRDGISYWVQMKRSAKLEAENRHDKIVAEIVRDCESMEIPKFFGLSLSENFKSDDIKGLVVFIGEKALIATREDSEFCFPDSESRKAKVKFWLPSKVKLTHLTWGFDGGMGLVNVTGLVETQMRNSFIKAAGAFERDIDSKNMNLIAIDLQNNSDIDICDAIFGTEFGYFQGGWSRKNNGFFHNNDFRRKVAGIVGLRRKEQTPVSDYYLMLFVNDDFKDRFDDMNRLLPFSRVVYRNMRPPMGSEYF